MRRRSSVLSIALLLVLSTTGIALAQDTDAEQRPVVTPESGTPPDLEGGHCITQMVPLEGPFSPEIEYWVKVLEEEGGRPVSVEAPGDRVCFESLEELREYELSNDIYDPNFDDHQSAAPSSRRLASLGAQSGSTFDIGTGGNIISLWIENCCFGVPTSGRTERFRSASSCTQQAKVYTYVGDWINDRMSSYTLSDALGCDRERLFKHANLVSGPYVCADYGSGGWPDCWYVGDGINDQISSWTVS